MDFSQAPGEVIELPSEEAQRMIQTLQAEPIAEPKYLDRKQMQSNPTRK
jgi:hypothetical protein